MQTGGERRGGAFSFFFFFEDLSRNVPRALLGVKRRKGILKRIIVDYLFTSRY